MRFPHLAAAALATAAVAAPAARAQTVTLTFEGLTDLARVGGYYDGGAGGSLGVAFDTTAYASVSSATGGFGNFQAAPSGTTALFFAAPGATFVNVVGGFTSFSLSYSAVVEAGTVSVYSGAGGTGALLGTAALAASPSGAGTAACPDADLPYCPFSLAAVAFSGTARSVVFGGAANQIVFDNLTFGTGAAAVVPEPSTFALAAAGAGALAVARRRRARPSAPRAAA